MERPPAVTSDGGAAGWLVSRRTICVLLLLLAALLAVNFWVPIIHSTFDDTASGVGVPQHDFFQYYAGGHNWDLGLDPYLNHPGVAQAIHHPRLHFAQISGYIYPPSVLPLMGGLAHYRYDAARTMWLALNAGFFALLIGAAVFVSKGKRLEVLTACVLLTLVSFPFFYHVHEGQIDMIVAALTIGAFLLYPRWHGWPSAVLLAVAIATKVSPLLILAVMVVYFRDWRFLLKTLVCGVAVFAISLAFVDFALYREYVVKILPIVAGSDPSRYNQTPLRFWYQFPGAVRVISLLGYAALVFLAWVAGRSSRRLSDGDRPVDPGTERNAVLLLAVLLMLLFSPLAWQMAYVWPVVPLALLLVAPAPGGRQKAILLLGVAAVLLGMRTWPYRVLDMTNIIGCGVAVICLLLYYLSFERHAGLRQVAGQTETPDAGASRRGAAGADTAGTKLVRRPGV
jgi:hypothetical protein